MRYLVLLRGSPGCGKSYFIKQNNLEQYTINADEIRLLFQTPIIQPNGTIGISQKNDKKVWDLVFQLLESRMERGEFTIIDATHSKPSDFSKYKKLKDKYRYRMFCVDFSDVPIEVTKERNAKRESYKFVPEDVIENTYARIKSFPVPNYVVTIKPEQFNDVFKYKPQDYSKYSKIHHIGDIHGCFDPLITYFKNGFNDDELYIFIGDYIDRGMQNVEVLKFLMEAIKLPNVVMLEGNHEIWLWKWANNEHIQSREFEFITKNQLENAQIEKSDIRQFYRKLAQVIYYDYHGKHVLVCHGGLSILPENLLFVASEQLIKGVGKYADMLQVADSFTKNSSEDTIQVFGHRNNECDPIEIGHCMNLCDKVEFGGNLRIYTLSSEIEDFFEIPNETIVVTQKEVPVTKERLSVSELIKEMEKYPKDIQKKSCGGHIYSYNFSREVFNKSIWNELTVKARGLFVNVYTNDIVARAYDKFHNIGQRDTTLYELKRKMTFPATAYIKENGYLGIVGYDSETDSLFIASKSTNSGDYAEMFKGLLLSTLGELQDEFKEYLKVNNLSALFEVIEPVYDPHIIKYNESKLVLLDLVDRSTDFKKVDYSRLCDITKIYNLDVKQKAYVFQNWEEFESWYSEVTDEGWNYNGENIEGFVVEDSNGYMVKIKLDYYLFWKKMRNYFVTLSKGHKINYGAMYEPRMNQVFGFMRQKQEEGKLKSYCSIIDLRTDYEMHTY